MNNLNSEATQAVAAGASPVSLFENPEFGSVRIIVKENGEPLFCGKDVATCLGYSDQAQAVRDRIDDEDKVVVEITTSYGIKPTTFINESGLYSLILGSKLDSAKKFKRWVTSEVLPSIRKTEPSEITSCISKDSVSEITVVNFLGRDIRVLGTPEDPLFIAKDVAEWIGLSNVSVMCKTLEEPDIRKVYISSESSNETIQAREVLAITEQGLYKILWRSNKPEAQKFASKCADIIKEIRLKGSYSVTQQTSYQIPQTFSEALQLAADIQKENERLTLENKHQARELEANKPKIQMYNDLMRSDGLITIAEMAKMMDMGTKTLYKHLRRMGILSLKNLPYQRFINDGSFSVKETPIADKRGRSRINIKILVTPKGQKLVHDHLEGAMANDMFI